MNARAVGPTRKSARRSPGKTASAKAARQAVGPQRGTRIASARRPYPRATLEAATRIPFALKEKNGGNSWPPSELATAIGLSHKNTDFFYMAAASRDFDFTDGSRDSDLISLTEFGRAYVYAASKDEERILLRTALLKIDIFRKVLEYYKGANLPEMQYLENTLVREFSLPPVFHEEFSRILLADVIVRPR